MQIEIISGLLVFVAILVMVVLGIQVGICLGVIGFIGLWIYRGFEPALASLAVMPFVEISSYEISILPLFILMGEFGMVAGLADGVFDATRIWFGRLRGSLALAIVAMNTALAACTGSSMASCVLTARTALPLAVKHGYNKEVLAGITAVAGSLAVLIPPSVLLAWYSILTGVSMGKLLVAGFLPGILSAFMYSFVILFIGWRKPELMPPSHSRPLLEKIKVLPRTWPILLVVTAIFGGLYSGVFTPTEVGGVGALLALGLAIAHNRGGLRPIKDSFWAATRESAMIFLLLIGATILVRSLKLTGITDTLSEDIITLEVSRWIKLAVILLMYFILGCFITAMPYMALTLPFVFPIMTSLGFDGIWFGIIVVKMTEIGSITPPVAFNVFAVHSVLPEVKIEQIFKNALPFLVAEYAIIVILTIWPQIVLFLPSRMTF
ncbi:MAG: TRAP transporter large permease [Chloroflexi bacterium]|nr:TRAP transporter large permease [Chloroflexota bacterium]